ncbi:patatin-like phospholipase family protein [Marinobacter caseinilyticus]|uniref:patatin-like phospholipase family protein n=1 Tax=Marinobacter caseinilyticus TaxID=2692195 RepID=UPI001F4129B3|nr:patatin-like phospholipase family protein [Marinobacter caseinilyticus]
MSQPVRLVISLLLVTLGGFAGVALAQTGAEPSTERPVVGLVLSGGGAKGIAHVGVLRVLEEIQVPVDVVVGTSAGAAVAAMFALGMPVDEIESRLVEMDWLESFRDSPGRAAKPVRRKDEDWRYPINPGLGVRLDGIHVGRGLISGQNLGFVLNELTREAALVRDFDQLPVRFRAVATDLETGKEVVIGDGSLSEAIRASMSIPGVYAPVERNGQLLVDGGVANNIPISVAKKMGADIIIAVDISDSLSAGKSLTEAFNVVGQLTTLVTRANVEKQLALLEKQDILIHPEMGELSSADFNQAPLIIEIGATAARNKAGQLYSLRVEDGPWADYLNQRQQRRHSAGDIVDIRINMESQLSAEFLKPRIRQQVGQPLNVEQLEDDLKRIYGLGYYETVTYSLTPSDTGTILDIRVKQKSWGPNYLSFGLGYADNFRNDTRFNVAAALQMTELNALGAEWTTGMQLGTQPRIRSQWFQPLDFGYRRFMLAGAEYERETFSVFDNQGERVAEVDVTERLLDLSLGIELGADGELRAGVQRGYATVDEQLGTANIQEDRLNLGGWNLRLVHDSLNDPFLPDDGSFFGLKGRFERPGMGSDSDFDRATMMAVGVGQWHDFVIMGQAYADVVTKGRAGIDNFVTLGGFRRLSAYGRGEVTGADAALVSVFGYQKFGGPFVPFFAGAGFETGNAWSNIRDARWSELLRSYSLFAGIDTFLGPIQLATAYNSDNRWTTYLNIGFSLERLFD